MPYNVDPQDQGEHDLGIQQPDNTWAWLWEWGEGIDDTRLPAEWQKHSRHPFPASALLIEQHDRPAWE